MILIAGFLALSTNALAVAPITINVPSDVVLVRLECAGSKTLDASPKQGVVTFSSAPKNCTVYFQRKSGRIDGPGVYDCSNKKCVQADVSHRPVSDAAGRVNVILMDDTPVPSMEINCESGYRERANVIENVAIFDAAPVQGCTLQFKGGNPAHFKGITPGTWRCSLAGTTAICRISD